MGRLDAEIFQRGLAQSRSRGRMLIEGGSVRINGEVCTKASRNVLPEDEITAEDTVGFVSRGGLKLEVALKQFKIDPTGKTTLDVGASTGGFTQCLLQNGAARVWAVDVGKGQMATPLAADERVRLFEGVNARSLSPEFLGGKAQLAVMDVSFISQTLLYPAVFSCVEADGPVITLIKPQFEAGREHLNKNGIVKDSRIHLQVLEHIASAARENGRFLTDAVPSPIEGGDGNREFLGLFLSREPETRLDLKQIIMLKDNK